MRFRDKIGPLHHPIPKPANLPDFLAVARILWTLDRILEHCSNLNIVQMLLKCGLPKIILVLSVLNATPGFFLN
jgi:hypothetical protein